MSDERYDRRIQTVCLLVLTGIAVAATLYWSQPLMIPFVVAVFAAFTLTPLVDFQVHRWHLPRMVAIVITLALVVAVLLATGLLATVAAGQLLDNADMYQERFAGLVNRVVNELPLERVGLDREEARGALDNMSVSAIRSLLDGLAEAMMSILSQGTLVLVFLFFLLAGDTALSGRRGGVLAESASMVRRYLATQLFISTLTGALVGLALWLLKVDLALTFGFLAFVLNFVPNIGGIVATLLPLPVVLLGPEPQITQAILVLAIPGTIQFLLGNVVVPKVMGQSLDLHPVTILAALIFWGMLWGMAGVVLAVPITAVARIWFIKFNYTRPIANVMAGRAPGGREPPSQPTNATL